MDSNLKQVVKETKAANKSRSVQVVPGQDGGEWNLRLPDSGYVFVPKVTNGEPNGTMSAKFDVGFTETEIANGAGYRAVIQGKPVIITGVSNVVTFKNERDVMMKNREKAEKQLATQIKKWGGVTKTFNSKGSDGKTVKLPLVIEEKFKLTWRQLQMWVAGEVVTNSVEGGEEFNHPINRFQFEKLNEADGKAVVKAIEAVQDAASKGLSADVRALLREFLDKDQLTPGQREQVEKLLEEKGELEEEMTEQAAD